MNTKGKVKAAAVQAAPVLPMDKAKTTEKICDLISTIKAEKADLVVFPETMLPMFPVFSLDLNRQNEWCCALKELTEQSVYIDGDEINKVAKAINSAQAYVVLGISEREGAANLYNSQVFFDPNGKIIGRRRKIFPSNREKAIWASGSGADIQVLDTNIGKIGGLICYEHLQPLLRYANMSLGEQIHCAAWPGWPHVDGFRSNKHVIDASARQYALEGQCFVIISSLYIPPSNIPEEQMLNSSWAFFGGSGIIRPNGEYTAGPIYDKEAILYGELDLDEILLRKTLIDTVGRDMRQEIFHFSWERN